jgi:hypothetical protein
VNFNDWLDDTLNAATCSITHPENTATPEELLEAEETEVIRLFGCNINHRTLNHVLKTQ